MGGASKEVSYSSKGNLKLPPKVLQIVPLLDDWISLFYRFFELDMLDNLLDILPWIYVGRRRKRLDGNLCGQIVFWWWRGWKIK